MEKVNKTPLQKAGKILLISLLILLGLVVIVLLGFRAYMQLPVLSYYSAFEKAFEIPGLDEDFVPQGFCYDETKELFLISGYSAEKNASPVYIVDKKSGDVIGKVLLHKENGSKFTGHAGGIAQYEDNIYIAGSSANCLYIYSYSEMLEAEYGAVLTCRGKFSLALSQEEFVTASFVTAENGRLVVGEFRFEPDYSYPDSHKVTTSAGDSHGGLMLEFALSSDAEYGIDPTPVKAYTIRDKVQGVCFSDGMIYASTSYGLAHSYIYAYNEAELAVEGSIELIGHSLPLYAIDSASLAATYKIPPMSEELVMVDGKLHVMCESASSKYIFGKLIDGKWCYSTNLDEM